MGAGIGVRVPSPVEAVGDERLERVGVKLWVKRDDLVHPELPGNKWRKLKYNLREAAATGQRCLLTFGGAYSNHIRATAAAGRLFGLDTVGVIRGEPHEPLNWSLSYAAGQGMRLRYLDRGTYRDRASPEVTGGLRREFGDFYLLPEGGSNALAVRGCAELAAEIGTGFDVICCPCGTGGTLAGIAAALAPGQRAIGFSALRGGEFLAGEVERLQLGATGRVTGNWRVECGFPFGGYARSTPELCGFIADFEERHGLRLDWVYVAKMMAGIYALAEHGSFAPGTRIVAVITGPEAGGGPAPGRVRV